LQRIGGSYKVNKKQAIEEGKRLRKSAKTIFQRQNEWDVICILDACRYDTFAKINTIPGTLNLAISFGSSTPDWARHNFAYNDDFSKIVYVTANPVISLIIREIYKTHPFLHFNEVWKWGWNDKYKTVLPETVCETALKLQAKYPGNKIVVHFMQPHFPFVGSNKFKLDTGGGWQADEVGKITYRNGKGLWARFGDGEIAKNDMLKAYEDNLRFVLKYIENMLPQLKGRVIFTADHGEGFGEFGMFHHADKAYYPMMLKVPWFVVDVEKI
jgi:hypothetical protein